MRTRSRTGFTLIELMVAMALTLFIMVILSQAFVTALDTFSGMKGLGDMQQQLRTAEIILRDDLGQDHLEGKRRLSDLNFAGAAQITVQAPQAGFFAVRRSSALGASPAYVFEGNDASGLPSYRAVDQMIHMAVKRKGNRQENFFNTALQGDPLVLTPFFQQQTAYNVPFTDLPYATQTQVYGGGQTGFYSSQWAEVVYYLARTGSTEEPNNPNSVLGTPTYGLYRAQFAMVPDRTNVNAAGFANGLESTTFAGISCNPGANGLVFYSPADAAQGQRAIDLSVFDPTTNTRVLRLDANGTVIRETLVLPNVLSFHVQVMAIGATAFADVPSNAGQSWGVYDTARFGTAGYNAFGLKGIQVTLRVWDSTTRQTRQVTVVQDL